MYVNLERCLKQKGLSVNAAARAIGMPEPTFRTKLNGREFSISEAFSISDNLFPEYDFRYLFHQEGAEKETDNLLAAT